MIKQFQQRRTGHSRHNPLVGPPQTHDAIIKTRLRSTTSLFLSMCLMALTAATAVAQPAKGSVVGNSPSFSQATFRTRSNEIFGNVVKGYSLAVVHNGVLVGTSAGGVAVDDSDAPFPYPVDSAVPFNVGSTVKMVSSVALLSFFEKDPTTSVNAWLNRKIIDYFPELWRNSLLTSGNPNKVAVSQVTFRHLLQHKTGLEGKTFINSGVNPDNIGITRKYQNDNIKILTYILPYIVDPVFGAEVDAEASSRGLTGAALSDFYNQKLATYFENYMQLNLFDKVSMQVASQIKLPPGLWKERLVPSCNHKQSYAGSPYVRNQAWGHTGDIPLNGDVNGDGADDLIIWRPSVGQWFARSVQGEAIVRERPWGRQGDMPLVGDVDGDGSDDFIIWRPSNGRWFAIDADGRELVRDLAWGKNGDIPFTGDVNADGKTDFIVWRPSKGTWSVIEAKGQVIFRSLVWGREGDIPLVGDVNGNGSSDFIIWQPTEGRWFAREENRATIVRELAWGNPDDRPLVGDINGDGTDELVIFRPSSGQWFARKAEGNRDVLFRKVAWGSNDVVGTGLLTPLLGDVNGDGKDNLILYRPSTGRWSAAGRRYAHGYTSKHDNGPGSPAEDIAEPPGCYAQGGYWFSTAEYVAWVGTFGQGNTFVSQSVRDLMFDATTESSRGNRLGWSGFLDVQADAGFAFVTDEFGLRYLPYHGGSDPNSRHQSAIIRLPGGYYAFGAVNSPERSSGQIARGLLRAWIAAMGGE